MGIDAIIHVPIWGTRKAGEFKGNLKDGIDTTMALTGIVSGPTRLYIQSGHIWIHFVLKIINKTYAAAFPLPFTIKVSRFFRTRGSLLLISLP